MDLPPGGNAKTENITNGGDAGTDDAAKHAARLDPCFVSQPLDYDSDTKTEVITSTSESPSSGEFVVNVHIKNDLICQFGCNIIRFRAIHFCGRCASVQIKEA